MGAVGGDGLVRQLLFFVFAGEEHLEEMARSRAREARSEGREVLLPAMDSRERWVVHNALKTVDGVRSERVGEGRLKRVKIYPA